MCVYKKLESSSILSPLIRRNTSHKVASHHELTVADAYNPRMIFWVCVPLAASVVVPTALGYLADPVSCSAHAVTASTYLCICLCSNRVTLCFR